MDHLKAGITVWPRRWAADTEAAIRQGKHFPTVEARRHTLAEAVDRYIRDVLPGKRPSSQYAQTIQLGWWIDDNPLRRVSNPKEPRGRVRFLSDDERARLLEACRESRNPYLYTVVVIALSTGMRKMEILGLTWADVDFERRMITIVESKNGERRAVSPSGRFRYNEPGSMDLTKGASNASESPRQLPPQRILRVSRAHAH